MTLRGRTLGYMKSHHLTRQELAEMLDIRFSHLAKYLDGIPLSGRDTFEAQLQAYFLKADLAQSRLNHPDFIETTTARVILEKCQEADEQKDLALLYGPSGIGKTFALEEFVARTEQRTDADKPEVLMVTGHAASSPKSLMVALSRLAGIPGKFPAAIVAEALARKLETDHYLIIVDEANHLNLEAMELLRYIYDKGHLGVVLAGTLRLYEIFTDGSRPASELEQLWSRVGISEMLPGLTEYEGRQVIQRALGRIPEVSIKQIIRQTGNSIRRLTKLLERLKKLMEINEGRELERLVAVAGCGML